jgi:hydrogenase maturation protein HypF
VQTIIKIDIPFLKKELLACGAEVKNTFCLTKKGVAFLSPLIGDLENLETLCNYEQKIEAFIKELCLKPTLIVCDLHPEYLSTKYAKELARNLEIKVIAVQHHHAHVASCMAEHNLKRNVIGVSFDGTGFGEDANIWGGEFLIAGYNGYERLGHLDYIPMPGGKFAILEPWRMAAAYLYRSFGDKFLELNLDFVQRLKFSNWLILRKMISRNINSPLTSSMGRLFDAVSSLLGIRDRIEYEAQAAIELEKEAANCRVSESSYSISVLENKNGMFVVEPRVIIEEIVKDLKAKVERARISLKFHTTIAEMIVTVCKKIREKIKLNDVVLSGGVFQNKILLSRASQLLNKQHFSIYVHNKIPAHDGGISLGQAAIANSITVDK